MKLKDSFKIGKHRQSKIPLAIAIGILLGGFIGIAVCLILNEALSIGFALGGFVGLFAGFLIGALLDLYEKRKNNSAKTKS